MKDLKKLLQCAKKFEDLQLSRKAKDVEDHHKFALQKESYNHHELVQILDADRASCKSEEDRLAEVINADQEGLEVRAHELLEAETFNQEAFETLVNFEDVQSLSEAQDSEYTNQPESMKQLPPGPPDLFAHELSEVTEACLQREITNNESAIRPPQEEEKPPTIQKTYKGPLFLTSRSS
jgi:hypothetical protein